MVPYTHALTLLNAPCFSVHLSPPCFCSRLITNETPIGLSSPLSPPLLSYLHLTILSFLHSIFTHSSQCASTPYMFIKLRAHLGPFQLRLLLIHSLEWSLCVFKEAGPGLLSVFTLLTPVLSQPGVQLLCEMTPIYLSICSYINCALFTVVWKRNSIMLFFLVTFWFFGNIVI